MAVRISYKPAATRIPYSHAEEKTRPKARRHIFFLGAAERIPHSHGKEKKKHVRGSGGVIFFLGVAVKDFPECARKDFLDAGGYKDSLQPRRGEKLKDRRTPHV